MLGMKEEKNIKLVTSEKDCLPKAAEELILLNPKELETWKNRVLYIMNTTPNYDVQALTSFCSLAKLKVLNHNRSTYLIAKRFFDFALSFIALLTLSPLLISLAAYIRYKTKGPIFFRQLRVGQYGIPFYIYKFRTIKMEYENVYPIPTDAIIEGGLLFRNFKFDELPQLINVLLGEMSFVGPRPLSIEDSAITASKHHVRFAATPGLTGLWQIYIPRAEDINIKTHMDAKYIEKRSLVLDLELIIKTIPVLLIKNRNNKHVKKQYSSSNSKEKDAA
jgi:lipopolysaccharide/colanic/teichoic acid biosynthesis glycosyltransferase